jgi:hypothetical protein
MELGGLRRLAQAGQDAYDLAAVRLHGLFINAEKQLQNIVLLLELGLEEGVLGVAGEKVAQLADLRREQRQPLADLDQIGHKVADVLGKAQVPILGAGLGHEIGKRNLHFLYSLA